MVEYQGNIAAGGIALGQAFVFNPWMPCVERRSIEPEQTGGELRALEAACAAARGELEAVIGRIRLDEPERAEIFAAHQSVLDDVEVLDEIQQAIKGKLYCASWAISEVYDGFIRILAETENTALSERASDMQDVCSRLLRCLAGGQEVTLADLPGPCIVVAEELLPSDTISGDAGKVLGSVCERGGVTSHTAIIARSYGIPALLGVKGATQLLPTGTDLILDALEGKVIAQPTLAETDHYSRLSSVQARRRAIVATYRDKAALTKDGVRIEVAANIGSAAPDELAASGYTDGVGLFRTEFLYMRAGQLPDEQTQYWAYRAVLQAFGARPVVLRTLDIGGDKTLDYKQLPHEDNPFLGRRAIRLCLAEPEVFHTQLKAALRASVAGNLWLMIPMVGGLEELRAAKRALQRAKDELDGESIAYSPDIKLGVMIEVPSAALIADLLAQEADFASIGTNDLIQYLTAADRLNGEVADYYQPFHPAVLRLIGQVCRAFASCGKPVAVCGELAGSPAGVVALLGLGVRKLSMSPTRVAEIKHLLARITADQAQRAVEDVLTMATTAEIEACLTGFVQGQVQPDGGC